MKKTRIVVITRRTDYENLIAEHGTRQQARFFLKSRGQTLDKAEHRHELFGKALRHVLNVIPIDWRRIRVDRDHLDRFLFEPDDIAVIVGGNGLAANAAKYLRGQLLIGLNPNKKHYDGILVPHDPSDALELMRIAASGKARSEDRAMVEAVLDDGQSLIALNEIFLGQPTHRSARYTVSWKGSEEFQTSSGMIITTGTGATGWGASIQRDRKSDLILPKPAERRLVFYIREAAKSVKTGVGIREGEIGEGEELVISSRMNNGGTVFGDGVEDDCLDFGWGRRARLRLSDISLRLMVA